MGNVIGSVVEWVTIMTAVSVVLAVIVTSGYTVVQKLMDHPVWGDRIRLIGWIIFCIFWISLLARGLINEFYGID